MKLSISQQCFVSYSGSWFVFRLVNNYLDDLIFHIQIALKECSMYKEVIFFMKIVTFFCKGTKHIYSVTTFMKIL